MITLLKPASYVLLWLCMTQTALAAEQRLLVLGDSISAAYGINTEQGWVALLQNQLKNNGYDVKVINASVSGDTTRTGLNRLEPALQQYKPTMTIVALGGNDGLRGLPFSEIEHSLTRIIALCRRYGSNVLLAGVRLPPNYGAAYTQRFAGLYQQISTQQKVPLVAQLLDQVADRRELLQEDGIHPTAEGQAQIMHNVWRMLEPLVKNTDPQMNAHNRK